ncbi:hypothetical protein KTH71_07240 [Acinetobacter sp. WU_MDCI_Axc73]|nr:hypothetical protein [Acinetobacter sp. WU_MDCI_Axc73]
MKEKKDLYVKFLSRLRHFNLRKLGAALVIGNALYFSYSIYFHHGVSPQAFAMQDDQNNSIQLIK